MFVAWLVFELLELAVKGFVLVVWLWVAFCVLVIWLAVAVVQLLCRRRVSRFPRGFALASQRLMWHLL